MTHSHSDRSSSCVACNSSQVKLSRIRLGYPIFSCASCRTEFAALSKEQLPSYDAHYDDSSHYGGYHRLAEAYCVNKHDSLYWFQRRMLEVAGSGDGRLHIDIGSGLGTFLCHGRDQGWRVLGVDVSALAARIAKETFDIDTHVGTLETASVAPASVHWISAFEVIEHMYNPRQMVALFFELLAPGGLVTISVPNGRSRMEMYSKNPILTPPTHVNYFIRKVLNAMFTDAGFSRLYDYEKPLPWGELPIPKLLRIALLPLLVLDKLMGHGGNRLLWVGRKPMTRSA
jgi:SAM-dependent methyltransferase